MKTIQLTQNKVALVDDEDYEQLSKYKWCAHRIDNNWYAVRCTWNGGKRIFIQMHRDVLGLKKNDGKQTDHKDFSGLNNQKSNLRVCTYHENNQNRRQHKRNTSGYKGVSLV